MNWRKEIDASDRIKTIKKEDMIMWGIQPIRLTLEAGPFPRITLT